MRQTENSVPAATLSNPPSPSVPLPMDAILHHDASCDIFLPFLVPLSLFSSFPECQLHRMFETIRETPRIVDIPMPIAKVLSNSHCMHSRIGCVGQAFAHTMFPFLTIHPSCRPVVQDDTFGCPSVRNLKLTLIICAFSYIFLFSHVPPAPCHSA